MNLRFQACVVSSLVIAAATLAPPSRAQVFAPHRAVHMHAAASATWTLVPQDDDASARFALQTTPRL